jgi:hypothetical protein
MIENVLRFSACGVLFAPAISFPAATKAACVTGSNGMAEQAAEKVDIAQPLKYVRENWAVPPGLESFLPLFPALKRWAKLVRPCRGWIPDSLHHQPIREVGSHARSKASDDSAGLTARLKRLRKNAICRGRTATGAEEAAKELIEGVKGTPQALKREHIFSDLTARVNSCPSLFAAKFEFFRRLFSRLCGGF